MPQLSHAPSGDGAYPWAIVEHRHEGDQTVALTRSEALARLVVSADPLADICIAILEVAEIHGSACIVHGSPMWRRLREELRPCRPSHPLM